MLPLVGSVVSLDTNLDGECGGDDDNVIYWRMSEMYCFNICGKSATSNSNNSF